MDQALDSEEVVISRAGRPLVRRVPVDQDLQPRWLGFLKGSARVEADLKASFTADIAALFEDARPTPAAP